jgi:hypothetical protein
MMVVRMAEEKSIKVQNQHSPKFIKKLICPQNAVKVFATLRNALMENVKLMKRNNHQSLSSNNQILIGKRKHQQPIQLLKLRKLKKLVNLQELQRTPLLSHMLMLLPNQETPLLKDILQFQKQELQLPPVLRHQ